MLVFVFCRDCRDIEARSGPHSQLHENVRDAVSVLDVISCHHVGCRCFVSGLAFLPVSCFRRARVATLLSVIAFAVPGLRVATVGYFQICFVAQVFVI